MYPRVAAATPYWLVVWNDISAGPQCIRACRVTSTLGVEDPNGFEVQPNASCTRHFSIASDGTDFLVAYAEQSDLGYHHVTCRLVSHSGVVSNPIPIAGPPGEKGMWLSAAYRDRSVEPEPLYLVVWEDRRVGPAQPAVYGARVSRAGVVHDPGGFLIATGHANGLARPAVASDGDRFLVVWAEQEVDGPKLVGKFVDANGNPSPNSFVVYPQGTLGVPGIAYDALTQTFAVTFRPLVDQTALCQVLDRSGLLLGGAVAMNTSPSVDSFPQVAGGDHFVGTWMWNRPTMPPNLSYRRVANSSAQGGRRASPHPDSAPGVAGDCCRRGDLHGRLAR